MISSPCGKSNIIFSRLVKRQSIWSFCPNGKWIPKHNNQQAFSRHQYSTEQHWALQHVKQLDSDEIAVFRDAAFIPESPAVLPRGSFLLPASDRWFVKNGQSVSLNEIYLGPFRDAIVALEWTKTTETSDEVKFKRFMGPLSLLLTASSESAAEGSENLYLAQSSLSDLPPKLQADFPVPDIIATAGKGDIYASSLWIGRAPTYTPLHRDPNPNILIQVVGEKRIRMLPADVGVEIYASIQRQLGTNLTSLERGEEMMMGRERAVLEELIWEIANDKPLTRSFLQEAVLFPGDAIFIPKKWWHSVKGVGKGMTGSVNWWFR